MSSAIPISVYVTISPPPIKSAHSPRCKASTANLTPVCDVFRFAKCVLSDFPVSQNKAATAGEGESPTQSARPAISPLLCRLPRRSNAFVASRAQSLCLRPQRTTTTTSCTQISSPASRSCPTPWCSMVTTVRRAPIRINPASCLPLDFSRSDSTPCPPKPPHSRTVLEHLLSGAPNPSAPLDQRCVSTPLPPQL